MKIILVLSLILISIPDFVQPWAKIYRWQCNSSGIIIQNEKCRVKSLSRYQQTIDIEFQLTRKVYKAKAFYQCFFKNGPYWRHIMKIDDIDLCSLARGLNTNPLLKAVLKFYKKHLPNLPSTCPAIAGNYSAKNVTMIMNPKFELNMTLNDFQKYEQPYSELVNALSSQLLPNGVFKHIIRFFNEEDPVGFALSWLLEFRHRLNNEDF